jgi:hypothetical protein
MARATDADALAADALTPITQVLRHLASLGPGTDRPDVPALRGLRPDLVVSDPTGWTPATEIVSGAELDDLLDTARRRWRAAPHAAAALAWKCYSYWLSLPAVLGYTTARRVPLMRPGGVVLRWSTRQPFLRLGITSVEVAVLPNDPILLHGVGRGLKVVPDETALLEALRSSLMDEHLTPILDRIHDRLHVGRRTLWGSLASGVAHGISRAADVIPGSTMEAADEVLAHLGVADLVELGPRAGSAGLTVQRRTCCLAFTLPEPHRKVCSGCCIRPTPTA